jgi:lysophospholipid acyltransferase (LPLAT)-like uncharacterized protein
VKTLLRSGPAQAILSYLASMFIAATLASIRWRFENRAAADAAVAAPEGVVACFWHGRIIHGVVCRRVLRKKPTRVLVSLSRDGEFISNTVTRLGFPTIRGSANAGRPGREKGGARALVEAVRFVRSGGVVAITPDGPRGPAQVLPDGPVQLARVSGAQVFLFGLAARPAITLDTWDRTQIPLPFGRGCVVFDGPLAPPDRDAGEATLEAVRLNWQTRLTEAQRRAEAMLAER